MCIKFEGQITRVGKYWAISVPTLGIYTQGKSKRDAFHMIEDAVELLVHRRGFKAITRPLPENQFVLHAKQSEDDRYLLALMLKNQRAKYGFSLRDITKQLGISKNAYAQYEHARAIPSLSKIETFIHAMNPQAHMVIDILHEDSAA